jgi:hypothetical protein
MQHEVASAASTSCPRSEDRSGLRGAAHGVNARRARRRSGIAPSRSTPRRTVGRGVAVSVREVGHIEQARGARQRPSWKRVP